MCLCLSTGRTWVSTMINLDEQINLFNLVGTELNKRTECLAIGGSAMMFYGAKESTKDVDLVFMDEESFARVRKVLSKLGFSEKKRITLFKHYDLPENKPIMMEGRGTRFDLFFKEIISFRVSESIMERAKEAHEFGNLIIKLVSPEDIILLKCATEREKDREDALELIKKFNIDWNIVIRESINQAKVGGDLFPVFLFDFVAELKEDFKADIPKEVIKKIRDIGEEMMIKALKQGSAVKVEKFHPE